ncbi:DNA damage-binding protein 1-like [Citrus sinensis]|uniref:DNA damage-binding protein 1-like n=1 Tax=Citrus clementina TaxID=85681 RepID=UPI000CED366F|nr:DNA damage-binding protein 1-like [Citrus x clementina]XP_052299659.1 DNA damage-binding protein 1-like [Citrus sinensis]XP_052299660.1 DNA damage-binding protein 1-like [Citrus sinensis]
MLDVLIYGRIATLELFSPHIKIIDTDCRLIGLHLYDGLFKAKQGEKRIEGLVRLQFREAEIKRLEAVASGKITFIEGERGVFEGN